MHKIQRIFFGKGITDSSLSAISHILAQFLSPEGLVAYFASLYWVIDQYKCTYGVWLIPSSILLNGSIKWIFRVPRPGWSDKDLLMKEWSHEYSFPSGHSQIAWALVTFFREANKKTSNSSNFQLSLFATIVSLSRVYMGVHYPRDVIAGAFFGWALAKIYIIALPRLKAVFSKMSLTTRLVSMQASSFLIFLLIWLQYRHVRRFPDPKLGTWVANAGQRIEPLSEPFMSYIGQLGVFSGLGLGICFLNRVHLRPPVGLKAILLRALLGYSGMLGSYFGIRFLEKRLLAKYSLTLQIVARFLRFGSVPLNIWLSMPKLFLMFGI